MKKLFLLVVICGFGYTSFAQSREVAPGDSVPWELRKQAFIYNTATLFNDPVAARMALYNLIAENPGNVPLYDSLALLYLQYNQNASAALTAQQALRINPNDFFATEIAATSFEQLGVKDKALTYYEKLYLNNSDVSTLYKIAFLQYELKRFAEAYASLDIVIGDPRAENNIITFPTADGQGQNVSLKISAHRVKAMILETQGDVDGAKKKYLEVLEMQPGFQVVQQQLRELSKSIEGGE